MTADDNMTRAELTAQLEALRRSQGMAQSLLNATQDQIYLIDLDGVVIDLNEAAARGLARSRDQLIGTCVLSHLPEGVAESRRARMRECIDSGAVVRTQDALEGRIFDTSIYPVFDENGTAELLAVFATDITSHKASEEALRSERAFLEAAFDASLDTFFVFDPEDGKPIRWNRTFRDVSGYTDAEIADMKAPDQFYGPEDLREAREALREVGEVGFARVELQLLTKSGARIPYEYVVKMLEATDGRALLACSVGRDITERQRVEENLRTNEERLDLAMSVANDGIYDWDITTGSVYFDPRYFTMAGYEPYEFPGTYEEWAKRVHPEDRVFVESALKAYLAGEIPVYDVEFRFKCKNGQWLWIQARNKIVERVDNGRPGRIVGTHTDISQRKWAEAERDRVEERLRQAQKMEAIGQLAGGVAHDFNNILTAIQGNAELLKMALPPGGEQARCADEVIKGSSRAADLTKQLLAFARKGRWRIVPVDIHHIVEETVSMLAHTIDRRIEVRLDLEASPRAVMGDPSQLQNALLNLGLNARDAMPDGGLLTYSTRNMVVGEADRADDPYALLPGYYLDIRVADTGAGIDAETQKKVFEPFFTTKEVGAGTGLGLAAVYGCVKNHDGSINISSEPGQGTTVRILLPQADAACVVTQQPEASDVPSRGTGHVLVVDDEESVRKFVSSTLRDLGYTVSACADGVAGVDYYRRHWREIAVVILDLIMPRMNGQDALLEMKKINPNVRVIVSSGFSRTEATTHLLEEGASAVLNKPFEVTELSEVVAKHAR